MRLLSSPWVLPAILNAGSSLIMLLLQQRPSPVDVVAIQPVMVDTESVLQIVHCVMPPTRHKNCLSRFLQEEPKPLSCTAKAKGRRLLLLRACQSPCAEHMTFSKLQKQIGRQFTCCVLATVSYLAIGWLLIDAGAGLS